MQLYAPSVCTRSRIFLAAIALLVFIRPLPAADVRVSEAGATFSTVVPGAAFAAAGDAFFQIGGWEADGRPTGRVAVLARAGGGDFAETVASLGCPLALSGATPHGGRVFVVGGLGTEGASAAVSELTWRDGRLTEEALPPLPAPVIAPGVAVHRSGVRFYLTVLGGLEADRVTASAAVWELELDRPGASWVRLPDLPMGPRVAPLARETHNEIVVTGGFRPVEGGLLQPAGETWGYARVARDGQVHPGWQQRAPMPEPVSDAAFAKTGQAHLLFLGGNRSGGTPGDFLAGRLPVDAAGGVWAFHSPTNTWVEVAKLGRPAFGGATVQVDDETCRWAGGQFADGTPVPLTAFRFPQATKRVAVLDWVVIAAYFVVTALIGFWFSRKQDSAEEFALGNRKMKWWAAAISSTATGVSTISFMAIPALIACTSLVHTFPAVFIIPGVLVGAFITYPMLRRLNITSAFEYLDRRFGRALRLFGSFNGIVVQMFGRIGVVVMLPALAISSMTGINPFYSVLAMGILTTLYSAAGGFEAVVWTDVFQGILMIVGFLLIGVLALANVPGGLPEVWRLGQEADKFRLAILDFDPTLPMIWFTILGTILGFLTFASDQATAQRVLATPMADVRKFAYLTGFNAVLVAVVAGAVGIFLFAFFKTSPEYLSPVMKNDQMVPLFLVNMVPAGISGLLLATLFAASMSTISSSVNSCSVLVAEDFYKRFRPQAGSRELMRVMQVTTLVAGAVGTAIALWLLQAPLPTLWETMNRIMALLGGGFGGVFILGMVTTRANQSGAIVGVVVAFVVAFVLQTTEVPVHYAGLGSLITLSCVITGYLASLVLPGSQKDLRGLTIWTMVSQRVTDDDLAASPARPTPAIPQPENP
jgi:SSS family transporter